MIDYLSGQPVVTSLLFSIIVNMLFFSVAFTFKTDKVTDLSYSLSFVLLAPLLLLSAGKGYALQQLLLTLAIIIWGLRLGIYLFTRILITKTDDRFDDKRNNSANLIGFWVLQTLAVWLIMLPFSLFLTSRSVYALNIISYVGFLLFMMGLIIEAVSDHQKFNFKKKSENKGKWMNEGLWRYSRHPNYFGEILVWWGLFIVTVPYLGGLQFISLLGPVSITLLLLFVSGIPLLEKSAQKKYGSNPEYITYRDTTSVLVLMPRKRKK